MYASRYKPYEDRYIQVFMRYSISLTITTRNSTGTYVPPHETFVLILCTSRWVRNTCMNIKYGCDVKPEFRQLVTGSHKYQYRYRSWCFRHNFGKSPTRKGEPAHRRLRGPDVELKKNSLRSFEAPNLVWRRERAV